MHFSSIIRLHFQFRQAIDGRNRVECTIVGPTDPNDQSLSPDSFQNQIIAVLRADNFSVAGTEISSGKHNAFCSLSHSYFYHACSLAESVELLSWVVLLSSASTHYVGLPTIITQKWILTHHAMLWY